MRLPYEQIPLPVARVETRPCAKVTFEIDAERVPYLALIDSGSLHTIASRSAFEGLELGTPEDTIEKLIFANHECLDVPVYRLSMQIVAPAPWTNIALPEVPVAVADVMLPFVILGSSALTHVVYVIRDAEQYVHIKTFDEFDRAKHRQDATF